ncbi:MAG: small basic family protein [Patescibacteria group bacterium]
MVWAIIGIIAGVIIGLSATYTIPIEYVKYTAVVLVGLLDSIFGAIKAEVSREEYNQTIFLTGLIFNIILAIGITLLGERLGLDLYLAVTVVFTFRIFSNLGIMRRALIDILNKKKK